MISFTSLLVATDLSVDGHRAVRRAALLAHAHGARLHILHVLPGAGWRSLRGWCWPAGDREPQASQVLQARAALRRVAFEIAATCDVTPTVEVVADDPVATLLHAAAHADLVVVGQRGRGRLAGWLPGAGAGRLSGRCRRPVLVVRTPAAQAYRRLLVPFDFSLSADAAVRVAAQLRGEADLRILHAIDPQRTAVLRDADMPEHVVRDIREMQEVETFSRLQRRVAGLGLDLAAVRFATAQGRAVPSALRDARQHGADLLVVGRRPRSALAGFVFGSVGTRLLSQAGCDVLIVPGPPAHSRSGSVAVAAPPVPREAAAGSAPVARGETRPHEAPRHGNWIHNTARFMPRRPS